MGSTEAACVADDCVPLVQLAAVHAAVAESFPLREALEIEGLSPSQWQAAELVWKPRLVAEPACMEEYRSELAAHQDRLGRPVVPIDEQVQQWTLFLRCYKLADDPVALLADRGLGLNDLARLQRVWSRRMEEDSDLERKAAKEARRLDDRVRKGEPLALPALVIGERKLVPSPLAAVQARDESTTTGAVAEGSDTARAEARGELELLSLDRFASLSAALEHEPGRRAELLGEHGLTGEQADAARDAWTTRFTREPQLRVDFRALRAHFLRRLELDRHEDEDEAKGGALSSPWRSSARGPAFAPWLRPADVSAPLAASKPTVATDASGLLDSTAELSGTACPAEPLPFRGKAEPKFAPVGPHRLDPVGGTVEVHVSSIRWPTLPFGAVVAPARGSGQSPAVASRAPAQAKAAQAAAPARSGPLPDERLDPLGSTIALALVLPRGPVLPFRDAGVSEKSDASSSGRPASSGSPAPKRGAEPAAEPHTPMPSDPLGGTLEVQLPRVRAAALPFAARSMGKPQPDPFDEPLPITTLEQFASLNAELEACPAQAGEIRRRYLIADPVVETRVQAHWRAHLIQHPTEGIRYEKLLVQYVDWVRRSRKG